MSVAITTPYLYHIHACHCYFFCNIFLCRFLCLPSFEITVYCLYNQHFSCVSFSIQLIHLLANTQSHKGLDYMSISFCYISSIRHHQFFIHVVYIIMVESCFPPFVQMSFFITYHFCLARFIFRPVLLQFGMCSVFILYTHFYYILRISIAFSVIMFIK